MLDNTVLLERYNNGDEAAKAQLVENNMGLVYSVVGKLRDGPYEREDLIQIGAIGLIKAVSKFDTSFGVQFSTYAVPKIAGEIRRFIRDDGTVKVSRSIKEQAAMIGIKRNKLMGLLGRDPTIEEISHHTGICVEEIAMIEILNTILSSSSIGLFNTLREKEHLAYSVYSNISKIGDCAELSCHILVKLPKSMAKFTNYTKQNC